MKKGKANMEIQAVLKVLRLKIQSLKESRAGQRDPDLQVFADAKVSLLEDLVALAPSYMGVQDFNQALTEEISEVGLSQRLSRNSFMVAAMRVKIGLLKEIQAILPAPKAPTFRVPRKSALFVSA